MSSVLRNTPTLSSFQESADESPALIWLADADGRCYWFNRGWLTFTGRRQADESGNGWSQGVHPDDYAHCLEIYHAAFAAREPFLMEYRLRRHDGSYRWIIDSGAPRFDPAGEFLGYGGIGFDIHERKTESERVREQGEFINAILECEPESVSVHAPSGELLRINRAGLQLFEATDIAEIKRHGPLHFIDATLRDRLREVLRQVMTGERVRIEFEFRNLKGNRRMVEAHLAPLCRHDGQVSALIAIARDVTERAQLLMQLSHQARTDCLTGLYNRRYFYERAAHEAARVTRYGGALSALLIDIDHFKSINDRFGHTTGDAVLASVGKVFRETLRGVDMAGRLGGEEFAILLPGADPARAFDVAERLGQALQRQIHRGNDGIHFNISASIGVASHSGGPVDIDRLIQRADNAMYRAKSLGRNRIEAGDDPGAQPTPAPSDQAPA